MKVLIKNGFIVTNDEIFESNLYIENDKVKAIGSFNELEFDEVHDVKGMFVMPGAIDPHTHLELQQSEKFKSIDDFYTGTVAAAVGGTTMIIDHIAFGPEGCNLHYSIDHYHDIAKKSVIDYGFHGVIQHVDEDILKELSQIVEQEGIPSFKAYSTYGYAMSDVDFYLLLQQMKKSNGLLTVHCENDQMTNYLRNKFLKEGKTEPIYHAYSRPNECEAETVDLLLNLAKMADDALIYIVHTSAKESLERIELARDQGQTNVFCETCTQYLVLDESFYTKNGPIEGTKYLMAPPLRKKEDNFELWEGIERGEVDTIGTDHCPFFFETEKKPYAHDFTKAPGGAPGIEERVRVIFTEGVQKGRISIHDFVSVISTNAAKIFGMYPQKGSIMPGSDADILVINPNEGEIITADKMRGNSDYTPYEGFESLCKIHKVFSKGKLIAEDNEFKGNKGDGKFIHRKIARD